MLRNYFESITSLYVCVYNTPIYVYAHMQISCLLMRSYYICLLITKAYPNIVFFLKKTNLMIFLMCI